MIHLRSFFGVSLLLLASQAWADPLNVGKDLAPPSGSSRPLGDMPMALQPSPDGKFMLVLDMGYRDTLWSVPVGAGKASSVEFAVGKGRKRRAAVISPEDAAAADAPAPDPVKTNGLYYGLAVSSTGRVFAAQGAHDSVAVLQIGPAGSLTSDGQIGCRTNDFPAGLALDSGGRLFVVNNAAGVVPRSQRHPASLAIYDTEKRTLLGRYAFESVDNTSTFPLAVQVTHDGRTAYVSGERDGVVYVIDASDPTKPKLAKSIPTGSHPTALLLDREQRRLFVTNSLSDTVSVIDTASNAVAGTALLRPDVVRGLVGATPTALALSPDEKTLYVTLSDMDAIGVVDVASLTLRVMLPVGDYPSAVQAMPDGKLMVLNAKGETVRHPNPKYMVWNGTANRDNYILNLLVGTLEILSPGDVDMHAATDRVMAANHLDRPFPEDRAALGPAAGTIKHVIYIVKENRTYDQVLGDDARGNGDPKLTLFGKDVTPNLHAIADRFVLLDNCYACGEVSGDGWVWSTEGAANAYVERNIPYQYSNRGRTFDYEGENNGVITGGFPATDPDGKPLSQDPHFKNGGPVINDIGSIGTHLWDVAEQAGVSVRNYGFFLSSSPKPKAGPQVIPDNYPTVKGLQPPGHDLAGVTDIDFRQFDLDYPDSDAPAEFNRRTQNPDCLFAKTAYGKYNAPSRFAEWDREFKQMLAKDPAGSAVPALMLVRLPHDHTQGLLARHHTPRSEVTDNDYGVAQLVQAVSESPIWNSTAIFVIEDDAQAGPDHVDAHRTTAYVISPWIKRASVDHRFYNTDSLLKTMELLLNLKPMSQYDAIANPIDDFDSSARNIEPYKAIFPSLKWVADVTPARDENTDTRRDDDDADRDKLAAASANMDFIHADAAPAAELNEIIWKSVKGVDSAMPASKNTLPFPAAGPAPVIKKDDDGD